MGPAQRNNGSLMVRIQRQALVRKMVHEQILLHHLSSLRKGTTHVPEQGEYFICMLERSAFSQNNSRGAILGALSKLQSMAYSTISLPSRHVLYACVCPGMQEVAPLGSKRLSPVGQSIF